MSSVSKELKNVLKSIESLEESIAKVKEEVDQKFDNKIPTMTNALHKCNELEVSIRKYIGSFRYNLSELEFSFRTLNVMENLGIKKISELTKWSKSELLKTKKVGRKSLHEMEEALKSIGLNLKEE